MDTMDPLDLKTAAKTKVNKWDVLHAEANAILKGTIYSIMKEPRCTLLCHHARVQ
jgi:hypothetical protein